MFLLNPIRNRSQNPRRGFALIIALGLMSFILLLLMSITAIVRVESQSAALALHQLEARQNALLGAMVAVGELQRMTGPDQRVTATAAIFDTDAGSEVVSGVNQPHWLGVWDAAPGVDWLNNRYNSTAPYYDYAARRDGSNGRFLGWLVSGSQNNRSDVGFPLGFDSSLPAESERLVGMGFDDADPLQSRNRVQAAKVDIPGAPGATGGRYAFWVGDESVKAQVKAFDDNPVGVPDPLVRRTRFMVNQRSGLETMRSTADNPFADFDGFDPSFARLHSLDEILFSETVVASGVADDAQRAFLNRHIHSLSLYGRSLLTNTVSGGLRVDLSAFLRNANASGLSPFSGLPAYRDGGVHRVAPPFPGIPNHPAPEGPTWEQMADYFQNRAPDGSPRETRKHTVRQSGVHPVITRFRLDIIPLIDRSPNPAAQGDDFYLYFAPLIVLNNPYDHPLTIPANSLRVYFLFEARDESNERGVALIADWVKRYSAEGVNRLLVEALAGSAPSSSADYPWNGSNIPDLLENGELSQFVDSNNTAYRGVSFLLPGATLEAGAVVSFGLSVDGDDYTGENLLEVGAFNINPPAVRLLSRDAASNPLRASLEWSQALDDSASRLRYWPTTDPRLVDFWEQGALHLQGDGPLAEDARLNPFLLTIGLSEGSAPVIGPEDFLYRAEGILCSNPNVNTRYHSSHNAARNQRQWVEGGLDDYAAMSSRRAIRFDVSLSGAFRYGLANDRTTPVLWSNDLRYGFLINSRWAPSPLWSYSVQRPSSADDRANPNFSYGAVASYSPFAEMGMWNMHNPTVELLDERAFWGTGVEFSNGERQVGLVGGLRDLPALISLGQLRHFPLSFDGLAAGSSFAHGISPRRLGNSGQVINATPTVDALEGSPLPVDKGYVINDRLWDGFFFSGLAADVTDAQLNQWDTLPMNQRLRLSSDTQSSRLNNPALAAGELEIEGGFNVNSVSVGAWQSILAGANRLAFDPVAGTTGGDLQIPFSRTGFPLAGSADVRGDWVNGFRELSEAELQLIAEAIVSEVKRRGPFLSLADFVNRRLQPGDGIAALFGTIEAAIRASGINQFLTSQGGEFTAADYPTGYTPPAGMIPAMATGAHFEGLAQWLNQSDVLERIAPFITVRGDTFVIRAYGETRDPVTGALQHTARCELLVQRSYNYVDSSNSLEDAPLRFNNASEEYGSGNLTSTNTRFGRSYQIIQFKWL